MEMKSRKTILICLISFLVVCAGALAIHFVRMRLDVHHAPERRGWKDAALRALRQDLAEPDYLVKRFGKIPGPVDEFDTSESGWLTSDTIVCKDGSWLAYRSQCHKQDPKVYDIFVARASDKSWYYSDYHFCIGAMVLRMNGQPESLEQFRKDCSLVRFDGFSDDALEPTKGK